MDKQEIIQQLKVRLANDSLKLPEYIEFNVENLVLNVHLSKNTGKNKMACLSNMQENESAFEGWSICLKFHLSEFIDEVSLSWTDPLNVTNTEQLHYNRFLYRVLRFRQMFSWFVVSKEHEPELLKFENSIRNLSVNSPNKDAGIPTLDIVSEKTIEYNSRNLDFLKSKMSLKIVDHQLPVGVFKSGRPFFTGKASGIDIWGIDDADNLNVFELKYKNKKVGIITELLFYSQVCHDVFLTGQIRKPQNVKSLRGAEFLYSSNAPKIQGIKAYFLTDELHPLVAGTTALLNSNSLGIKFFNLEYKLNSNTTQIQKLYAKGAYQLAKEISQLVFRKNQGIAGNKYFVSNFRDNLFEDIRNDAVQYFEDNQISWWSFTKDDSEPTKHMLSSQIQCLNFLYAIRRDKSAVLRFANLIDPDIEDIYPTLTDKDEGFLAFEFIYENKRLINENDKGGKRGKYLTSIDVFLIVRRGEKKLLVPIEWKYTETYLIPENKALEKDKGQTRQARYNQLIVDSMQLKTPNDFTKSLYYFEPYYELMRQTLLVEQMVKKGVADDFLHIMIAPNANTDLLQNSYLCEEQNLVETWKKQLQKPEKFKQIDSSEILDLFGSLTDYSELYNYLKLRYV